MNKNGHNRSKAVVPECLGSVGQDPLARGEEEKEGDSESRTPEWMTDDQAREATDSPSFFC